MMDRAVSTLEHFAPTGGEGEDLLGGERARCLGSPIAQASGKARMGCPRSAASSVSPCQAPTLPKSTNRKGGLNDDSD